MALYYPAYPWVAFVYLIEAVFFYWTIKFGRDFKREAGRQHTYPLYKPRVSLIVPCKGLDYGFEENVKAMLRQDYRNYEVIFAVDDYRDPAYRIVRKYAGRRVKVVKSIPTKACSGKIAAQLAGIRAARGDVLAFADSDTRPQKGWLRCLISPLSNKRTGVTTGYRWYFSPGNTFWGNFRSAWNTIGFGIMFSRHAFVWGGSFAMRRRLFDRLRIAQKLRTEISDDTVVTKAVREAGLKIHFVPKSIVASFDDSGFRKTLEWIILQTTFVRYFAKKTARLAAAIYGFFLMVLASGIASILWGVFADGSYIIPGLLLLLPNILMLSRNYYRYTLIRGQLPQFAKFFQENMTRHMLSHFLVNPVTCYALFRVWKKRHIIWRGRKYMLRV